MKQAFKIFAVFIFAGLSIFCNKKTDTVVSVVVPATDSTNLFTSSWFVETTVEGGLEMLFALKDTVVQFSVPTITAATFEVDPFDSLGKASAKIVRGKATYVSDRGFVKISSLEDGTVSGIYSFEAKDLVSGEVISNHGTFANLPIEDNVKVVVKINTMDTIWADRAVLGYEVIQKDNQLTITDKGICISLNSSPNLSMRENKTLIKNNKTYAQFYGLFPNTRYYVRPFAKVKDSLIMGRVSSFVTQKKKPEPQPIYMRRFFDGRFKMPFRDTLKKNSL